MKEPALHLVPDEPPELDVALEEPVWLTEAIAAAPVDDPELEETLAEGEAIAASDPVARKAWESARAHGELERIARDARAWREGLGESLDRAGAGTEDQYLEMTGSVPPSRILAADELMARRFPELVMVITGLIAAGLTLLVSSPKIGKSWLVLGLGVAVAAGGRALGLLPVEAGDVLVLALEDTQRRLQGRLATILDDGVPAPARLHLATSWPRLDDGGLELLREWLAEHPDARLIVVDTLAVIRPQPAKRRDGGLYDEDYAALRGLKALADEFGVAIVAVHHTRKMAAVDPLDLVNGTHGLSGAADAVLVLERSRVETDAKLHVMGRDVEEATHRLTWSPGAGTWAIIDPVIADASLERREILDYLAGADGPRTPTVAAVVLGRPVGTIKRLMWEMSRAHQLAGGGRAGYTLPALYTEPTEPGTMEPGEPPEPGEPGDGLGSFGSPDSPPAHDASAGALEDPARLVEGADGGDVPARNDGAWSVPCAGDPELYRAHAFYHHRRADGSGGCRACETGDVTSGETPA